MIWKATLAFALLASLTLIGCNSQKASGYQPKPSKKAEVKPVDPGKEATLFPMAEGNQWTFEVEAAGRTDEITLKVISVSPMEGGIKARLEFTSGTQVIDKQAWEITSNGIFQLSAGNPEVTFSPRQTAVPFPIEVGKKFAWKGTALLPIGQAGPSSHKNEVQAWQLVDSGIGRVTALPIQTYAEFMAKVDGQDVPATMASTTYWSPEIGLVRYVQRIAVGNATSGQTLRLKSYVVK